MRSWPLKQSSIENPSESITSLWLFYLIAAIGIIISLLFWYTFVLQSNANLQRIVSMQTQHLAKDLNSQFVLRISALKQLAKHLNALSNRDDKNNQNDVTSLLSEHPECGLIAQLNADLSPIKQYSGLPLPTLTQQDRAALTKATLKQQVWIKPQTSQSHHKNSFLVAIPDGKGLLLATLTLDLKKILSLDEDDYVGRISLGNQLILTFGANNYQSSPYTHTLVSPLFDQLWTLELEPLPHLINQVQRHLPLTGLILSIFIAILFAIASRLAHLTRMRTQALAEIHEDLQNESKERIQAEAIKQRLERALLQGQKLQAIGTLAGGIAHDFNNILYAIIGYVEMAQEDVPADSLIHKNLSKVLEGSKRGQELISRILTFSRRQVYEFKKMCLKETVKSVLSFIRPAIPASINISFSFDLSNSYIILGNQTQLHQIIMNIVNNAVDSMDGDGSISLSLSKADAEDPFLKQLPETKGPGYCKLEIADQGHGMDEHTIERIFEPFFTTKEVGKGTGLGLATAHAIAKEHQGDIMVISQLGLGSTFTLYLPLLDTELTDG